MNKIIIIGNLGADAEVRQTQNGVAMSLRVASSENRGGEESTLWFPVTYFAKTDKLSQYLQKGKKVYIDGRLREDTYTDRQGIERTALEVIAERLELVN